MIDAQAEGVLPLAFVPRKHATDNQKSLMQARLQQGESLHQAANPE